MVALNPHKTGIVGAALLGGWHVVWSILVAAGAGQALIDFVLWAHMIHIAWTVGSFSAVAASTLIVLTSAFGYVTGYLAAWAWNRVNVAV
jgi:hypothetical protein